MIGNSSYLWIALACLVLLSAFFSGSETGMMAINRYRLRHLARKNSRPAQRVVGLLERPDRLLGVILIGNTFANVLASAIATVLAVQHFGEMGALVATVALTFIILIFAETTPKTLAAFYPQSVAFAVSYPLRFLLTVLYPLVWLVNVVANSVLRLLRFRVQDNQSESLSAEELATVVHEARGTISSNYQQMLLRILNLERVLVEDVMVPRSEIYGIDITDDWGTVLEQLRTCHYAHVPVYRDNIDQVIGVLNLRKLLGVLHQGELNKKRVMDLAEEMYFVPEMTLLNRQLLNFQEENKSMGLVIDEYGDIQGLVTLQDILEEIVGEFSADVDDMARLIKRQKGGSYLVDGSISLRDLNRLMSWEFPTDGPKTLSGLIIEYLETIPMSRMGLQISNYPIEVVKVSGNTVNLVQIWPRKNNDDD